MIEQLQKSGKARARRMVRKVRLSSPVERADPFRTRHSGEIRARAIGRRDRSKPRLWFLFSDSQLGPSASASIDAAMASGDHEGVSAISLAEIVYLIEK